MCVTSRMLKTSSSLSSVRRVCLVRLAALIANVLLSRQSRAATLRGVPTCRSLEFYCAEIVFHSLPLRNFNNSKNEAITPDCQFAVDL